MKSGFSRARIAFPRAIRPRSFLGAFLAFAIGLAVLSISTATPAFASGSQLFSETFANNTVPTSEVVLPSLPSGASQSPPSEACLTAGGTPSGASAVPQCTGASDENGNGFLRFTDAQDVAEEGGVFSATSLPATQGLDVVFNSYQFGGNGADGIAFALAIANPTDPRPPAKIGDSGGSLGYGPYVAGGDNGLSFGYLGVGLDAFGNYSTTIPDGSDCSGDGHAGNGTKTPQAVSVRGPGDGEDGYCMIGGPWTDGSDKLDASTATSVPVEVAINPTGSAFTTASGLTVPVASYAIQWTPVGGTQQTETHALPNLTDAQYSDLGIPSSYYNSFGIPYQMTFGWVASTGGSNDYHEIRNVVVSNGAGTTPTLGLAAADNKNGEFGQGSSVGYTFTPSLSAATEAGTITFDDPFPAGLTPTSTTGTDPSWSCSIVSSTVTCTHAGVSAPSTLPSIDIAASVASNASTVPGALDDRGYVSANDALDADALDTGTAYGPATVTSVSPETGFMTGGTQVAVTGTNFNNVASVNVGSATVTATCSGSPPYSDCYTVNSPTSITLYTPTGSSAGGPGLVTVTVTNDSGTGSGSSYTYEKAPSTTTVASSQNPSVTGQAVSFTATVTPGATGSVTFTITPTEGSAVTCNGGDTVPVSGSTATCSVPSDSMLAEGSTYGVSANYGGDSNYSTSSGSLEPAQTVNLDATTTATPTSTVDPSVYGQTVTYATTVSSAAPGAGIPTGSAVFEETVGGSTTTMCSGTLNGSGVTSCTSSVLPPAGIALVQATYQGDSNYSTSTSSGLPQFVDPATTATGLSSNLSPSSYGEPVTFTATVSAQAPGGGTPAGSVAFSADGSQITGCSNVALNGAGQARCTTSSLSVADHTVVAAYGGNADYLSSSGTLTETVGEQATATSETSSVNPSVTGQSVTVTATVSFSGTGTPTGNVTFTMTPESGAAPQCSGGDLVGINASSSAACTLVLTAGSGPYQIRAEYDGDSNFDTSASSALIQDVTPASTTTSVSTSAQNAVTDQSITFTATVTAVAPGSGVPGDGTVGFDLNGVPVSGCASRPLTSGSATCTVSDLDVSGGPSYLVSAFYSGASDYSSSNDVETPLIQVIAPDATTTSLTSDTNPSTFGQNVNFTAIVTSNAPGGGTPTGTVTISADGSTFCSGLVDSGELSCGSSTLTAGTHQLVATYSASPDYRTSTSSTLTQGVNQSGTTTTVTSSDNPSSFGETVTITATVAPVAPGQGTPTGLVDFSNGIVPICVNVALSGGVATCTIDYPVGSYTIVAAYRGSAGFIQSSSQLTQVVQKAMTTATVVSAPTVVTGQGATYQAEVTVDAPGSTQLGNLSGTVAMYARDTQDDPQIALCSTSVGQSGATVSCSSSAAVAAGSPWAITAVYSGDANFDGSTSSAATETVNQASTTTDVSAVVNPSVTGQIITATAGFTIDAPGSDSPSAPTGTVEFEISINGGDTFSVVPDCGAQPSSWDPVGDAGSASCSLPSPPAVSSVELEAVYSGDDNFSGSTSPPFTQDVNQAMTSTTIGVDTNPSVSGETVNYTASVTVNPPGSDNTSPTGTVDFQSSANGGGTWSDIAECSTQGLSWDSESHSGSATCAVHLPATASGVEVQAVYSGDDNFDGSTSATPVIQEVNPAETTASVALVPLSSVSGQPVTATATVLITAPGSDNPAGPSGTVDFQYSTNSGEDWNDISGCTTENLSWDSETHTGSSSCATGFDADSSPIEIQAVYSGDDNFVFSTSPSATETVEAAATTTSLDVTPETSVSGQALDLAATVSVSAPGTDTPAGPSGSVDFQYSTNGGDTWGDISGCTTEDLSWDSETHTGSSSCDTAFAATSSGAELRAVYSGDANFDGSTSSAATETVNQASTTTDVSAVVNPSVTGQIITATAGFTIDAPGSDSPSAPTGTVEFEISINGGDTFSVVPDCGAQPSSWDPVGDAGSASCSLPSPPAVSSVELEAVYSGDDNFSGSTSPPFTQDVNQAMTSTTIGVDTNPSVSGETVNYTASVTVNPPGSDNTSPTGTVDFQSSANGGGTWSDIAECSTQGLSWDSESHSGSATCAVHLPATASGVEVQAVYSGDDNFDGSTSATPVIQEVNPAETTASVALVPLSSVSGQPVTATATVLITAPGSDNPAGPSGTVDFQYSTNSGEDWNDISGCTTENLSWDSETHTGSSSCATGFDADSSPIEIQAVYSGDDNFVFSTSPSATETVEAAATTTSLDVTPETSVSGQALDLAATVSVSAPGTDTPAGPSGSVDFQYSTNGGDTWGDISGCTTEDLSWDSETHTGSSSCDTAFAATSSGAELRAVYSGDANFDGSTSSAATETVNQASTTTDVSAVVNPSVTGQIITATAGFTIDAPGSDSPSAPTGTVEFEISINGGDTFSVVPDCGAQPSSWDPVGDAGSASCSLPSPPAVSSVELEAVYSGDDNFSGSTSPPFTQDVNQAMTSTTIGVDTNPSVSGETVNYTASVTVNPPGSDNTSPTGTVDFQSSANGGGTWSDIAECSTQGLSWDSESHSGSATCAVHLPATASGVEVQAVYSGDDNFDGSTSATPVIQEVNPAETTASVALVPLSSVSGQPVTATATVLITAPGSDNPAGPSGTVDFQYSTNSGEDWNDISGCTTENLSWDSETHTGSSSCATGFDADSSPIEIQAVYSGDDNFVFSTSPSATETVEAAATTTSLDVTPETSVSGQALDLAATVSVSAPGTDTPAGPSGSVDFQYSTNGGDTWGDISGCTTEDLSWDSETHTGSSSCDTAFAATSSGAELRAVYSGDANFDGSTSSAATETVNQASTTTDVSAVVNPSVTGQIITATAGFTIDAPGSDSPSAPTGTVEFEISINGGDTFSVVPDCGAQPSSWDPVGDAGSASCSLPSPPAVSSVELEAVYSGDDNFSGSTSPPFTQDVNQAMTSTTIGVDTNPSVSGETVNYTASVTVNPPGSDNTSPTGTVDFQSSANGGGTWSDIAECSTQGLSWDSESHSGSATCAVHLPATASGVEVQAVYSGDDNFDGSTSATPVIQEVNPAETTASVALVPLSSVSGQPVTATATVLITAPGSDNPAGPSGTVDFQYSTNSGEDWNDISGCTTENLSWDSETHTGSSSCATGFDADSSPIEIQAVYSGDDNFVFSTSPSATETVEAAATTTSLDVTPETSVSGQALDLAATVSVSAPGTDTPAGPSGSVDFQYSTNGGDTWGDISGCTTEDLSWDSETHTGSSSCDTAFAATSSGAELRAVYSGDANFDGSTSSAATETVNQASTTTALVTSANPSVNGQAITASAIITVDAPGGGVPNGPSGSVVFQSSTDGGATWVPVSSCSAVSVEWSDPNRRGTAQCIMQFGNFRVRHPVEGPLLGDANFEASESSAVTQTVGQSRTSTVVTSTPNSSGPLQPVTLLARVSVMAPGAGSLTGTVTFTDGASTLCRGVDLGASDSASCTSRIPITSAQTVMASYSGNTELAGSSGSVAQAVRHGYWLLGADGGVFSLGDAQFYGSLPQIGYSPAGSGHPNELNAPLVGICSTLDGKGYWLVASDGGVFTFGDAKYYGSTGSRHLNKPIVGMAITPDGKGYWLVASDGGIFAFGDAKYYGSTGSRHLNKPIVAMAITPDGKGYWLVASDGGVFAFGDAHYLGSASKDPISGPVVGLAQSFDGGGYWLATATGHVYPYGDATTQNGGSPPDAFVVGIGGTADGGGFWTVTSRGGVYAYGDAKYDGSVSGMALQRPIVGMSGL